MYEVNVNCMACHLNKTLSKGHDVRTASGETCAACHTEKHIAMLDKWKDQVGGEITDVEEVEAEVQQLLVELRDNLDEEQLKQVEAMIAKGSELVNIVRFGNGVHNKKYSITIIDGAFGYFEDSIDLLEESR